MQNQGFRAGIGVRVRVVSVYSWRKKERIKEKFEDKCIADSEFVGGWLWGSGGDHGCSCLELGHIHSRKRTKQESQGNSRAKGLELGSRLRLVLGSELLSASIRVQRGTRQEQIKHKGRAELRGLG